MPPYATTVSSANCKDRLLDVGELPNQLEGLEGDDEGSTDGKDVVGVWDSWVVQYDNVPSGRHFCPFCLFGGALWADYLTPDWFRSLFQISTAAILIPTSNLHDPPKIVPRNRRPSVLNEKSDIEKK